MSQIVLNIQDPFDPNSILIYDTENKTVSLVNESDKENDNNFSSSDLYYFI